MRFILRRLALPFLTSFGTCVMGSHPSIPNMIVFGSFSILRVPFSTTAQPVNSVVDESGVEDMQISDKLNSMDLGDKIVQLKSLSSHLRGNDPKNVDAGNILKEIKDITSYNVNRMPLIRKQVLAKKDDAVASIESAINSMSKTKSDGISVKKDHEEIIKSSLDTLKNMHSTEFQHLQDKANNFVKKLEEIESNHLFLKSSSPDKNIQPKTRFVTDKHSKSYDSNERFDVDDLTNLLDKLVEQNSGSNGRFKLDDTFERSPTTSLPNIFNFFQSDEISARSTARVKEIGSCNANKSKDSECENFFACIHKMTKYDLIVLYAKDFIVTDTTKKDFGSIKDISSLNVFNYVSGHWDWLQNAKAITSVSKMQQSCQPVLKEIRSACSPYWKTCTKPNVENFLLSFEDICDATTSDVKLSFYEIALKIDLLAPPFPSNTDYVYRDPISYECCAEFIRLFDWLMSGSIYSNPMRPTQPHASYLGYFFHDPSDWNVLNNVRFPSSLKPIETDASGLRKPNPTNPLYTQNYNYFLMNFAFPGPMAGADYRFDSTGDYSFDFGTTAMSYCDQSMSLLIGKETSLGKFRSIVHDLKLYSARYGKPPNWLYPGICCFDDTTENLGFYPDDHDGACQNTGSRNLHIAKDVCENAGGVWYRSPCEILKKCIDDRPKKKSTSFSPGFEMFAESFVINDSSDIKQCRKARQKLGFKSDFDDDYEVCDKFNERMCDPFFDGFDEMVKDLDEQTSPPINRDFNEASYPPNPPLEYKKLPTRSPFKDSSEIGKHKTLNKIQTARIASEQAVTAAGNALDALGISDCSVIPDILCVGACATNPLYYACEVLRLALKNIAFEFYLAADIAREVLSTKFELKTLGPSDEMDEYYYTKVIYENFEISDRWNHDSLGIINSNMIAQHTEMRKDLQDRHVQMVNCINCKSQNGFCKITKTLNGTCDLADCTEYCDPGKFIRYFEQLDDEEKIGGKNQQLETKDKKSWTDKETGIYENKYNDNVSKSHKIRKSDVDLKSFGSEDNDTIEVNTYKIKEMVNVMKAKVDTMERKVDTMEGKVDTIEGKVDAIEGKVDLLLSEVMSIVGQKKLG